MQDITFVGLDVHKATLAVSVAAAGRDGEVRRLETRPEVVRRLVERLRRGGHELRVCYEAGPCGYGLHRQLTELGCHCVVVAPALIPRRPGDRVKTDRRDATALATLHRAGELTPVWVLVATIDDIGDVVITAAASGQMLRFNGASWVNEETPYDLSFFLPGTYSSGALMAQVVLDRAVTFPDGLSGAQGYAGVNATATAVLDLQKNGANIGTITFTSAGSTAAFAMSGAVSFAAGDRLSIVNEDPADATLADLSLTLKGKRD